MNLREMHDKRANVWAQMQVMRDAVDKDGWTAELREQWDRADTELVELTGDIERAQRDESLHNDFDQIDLDPIVTTGPARRDRPRWLDDRGEPVPVLTSSDRLVDHVRQRGNGGADVDFDKIARGILTGNWTGAEAEQRAMSGSIGSAGGYAIPHIVAADILDLARNKSRVVEAGAMTIPLENRDLRIARLDTDVEAAWRNENAPVTESEPQIGAVEFSAQALAVLVKASREIIEDSPNVGDLVKRAMGDAIGVELDRVGLYGSGVTPEPVGVKNAPGVTSTILGGGANGATPTDYDFLIDAVQVVRQANYEPTAVIDAPRTEAGLAKLKEATTNAYLAPPPALASLPRLPTNQVPVDLTVGTSDDCSDAFVGEWPLFAFGMRTELRLLVLEERYADNLQVGFLAFIRADAAPLRSTAFTVVTGIRD